MLQFTQLPWLIFNPGKDGFGVVSWPVSKAVNIKTMKIDIINKIPLFFIQPWRTDSLKNLQ